MPTFDRLSNPLPTIFHLLLDALRFIRLCLRPRCVLAAENLFLRKQLALYLERQVQPRRPRAAARLTLVLLSRLFPWRQTLAMVKPDTFIRWHRQGFRLFWKWKSQPRGRPRIPAELQKLIVEMADDNPTWGEERVAAELLLKVGIRLSPRTVRRYMPNDARPKRGPSSQRWMTFVRNHAEGILACDFFITVTASFRVLYVWLAFGITWGVGGLALLAGEIRPGGASPLHPLHYVAAFGPSIAGVVMAAHRRLGRCPAPARPPRSEPILVGGRVRMHPTRSCLAHFPASQQDQIQKPDLIHFAEIDLLWVGLEEVENILLADAVPGHFRYNMACPPKGMLWSRRSIRSTGSSTAPCRPR
jgi:hypothetical protein